MRIAVDSSVLLDVLGVDPELGELSREALRRAYDRGALVACNVVLSEVHAHFPEGAAFLRAVSLLGIEFDPLARPWLRRPGGSGAGTASLLGGPGTEVG